MYSSSFNKTSLRLFPSQMYVETFLDIVSNDRSSARTKDVTRKNILSANKNICFILKGRHLRMLFVAGGA